MSYMESKKVLGSEGFFYDNALKDRVCSRCQTIPELDPGEFLFSLIKSKHHLNENEACVYFYQIINALGFLHLDLIAHCDLKPENILLVANNKRILITIFDLSII